MANPSTPDRRHDAQNILRRVAQETVSSPALAPEEDDWAELWGRRIGRVLGWLLTAGLLLWLVFFVLRG